MKNALHLFTNNKNIQEIISRTKKTKLKIKIENTTDNHNCLIAASLYEKYNKCIFYVASNVYKACKFYDMITKVMGYENVCLYISNEVVATEVDAVNKEFLYERLSTVNSLINNDIKIIVLDVNSALKELMPANIIRNNLINLSTRSIIDRKELVSKLIKLGYHKRPTTTSVGDFSVRGEIVDIFAINYTYPIRIDFFDDEIENIRFFDKDSQLSKKDIKINDIEIMPYTEMIYDDISKINGIHTSDYNILQDIENIKNYTYNERLKKYIHYFYDTTESILDYIDDKIIMFEDSSNLYGSYKKTIEEMHYYFASKNVYNDIDIAYLYDFYKLYSYDKLILSSYFKKEKELININDKDIININGFEIVNYQNNIKLLTEELKGNKEFVLSFSKIERMNTMKEILESNDLKYNLDFSNSSNIHLILDDNMISFGFYDDISVIDEVNIYRNLAKKVSNYRSTKDSSTLINSKDDLKIGDYIVHFDYGIGKYLGIKTFETKDAINDYIALRFANVDLYIPVENINLLEKYQGEEGYIPKLTNVGTKEWEKKKASIKEKLMNVARDLILLQAYRDSKSGYKYEEDNEIQFAFEDDFEYQETKDQEEITRSIKNDMENGKIIDRLICGDVGYGKTEIAIRIAMKTVLNSKQVAYLAPTTILSRQQYYNFKDRMSKYGVNVVLMNRLVSIKERNKILKGLKDGSIDVVIGTHSLLSDDIEYKDLGLLIVDEEQRFGVVHKEKIKQYKNNINVLTLSATPIPRTLQMAIMGARDMSIMENPPENRYPIQTYVLEKNDSIIKEAIYNELARGGQVFYLHNRVKDIEIIKNKIRYLVPEAKIIVAHGQMTKIQLENAMQAFIDHEYDVLLCTTIIETGIDIPNTNTLIVENADRLGLAQMYQIRGRVGRTNRVSYAYFMYDYDTLLTNEGKQRLQVIKEFTSLGSGYKIAMRDLAIRGAGDFLGKEQSGYIDAVGMDLYMKMLAESIDEIRGIKPREKKEISNFIEVSKHVDDSYVSDDDIKIYIHKTIDTISSKERRDEVIGILTDRFGRINDEIILYINKKYFDSLAEKLKLEEVSENDFKAKLVFSKESSDNIPGKTIMKEVYRMGHDYSIEYKNKRFIISIIKLVKGHNWIFGAIELLENIYTQTS